MAYSNSFDPFDDSRRYNLSPPGFSTGNPYIDQLLSMLIGTAGGPRPLSGSNQGIFDAHEMMRRNLGYQEITRRALADGFLAQRIGGIDTDSPLFPIISPFLADPNGMFMRGMSALQGGNPVQAQMRMFAGLTGQTSTAFGERNNITVPQTTAAMQAIMDRVYTWRTVRDDYSPEKGFDSTNTFSLAEFQAGHLKKFEAEIAAGGRLGAGLKDLFSGSRDPGDMRRKHRALEDEFGGSSNGRIGAQLAEVASASRETDPVKEAARLTQARDAVKKLIDEFGTAGNKTAMQASADQIFKVFVEGSKEAADAAVKGFTERWKAGEGSMVGSLDKIMDVFDSVGKRRPLSLNLEASRGFQLEDIAGAAVAAGDLRLINGRRGFVMGIDQFTEHGLAPLDAARSLYGNDKSGSELAHSISGLLGNSFYAMDDPKQASALEDLLRNVKASARVAGISVQSILGIIEQGQQLANANPMTRHLGGVPVIQATMEALSQATVMSSFFGNDYIRQRGGPVELTLEGTRGKLEAKSQPVAQRLNTLYALHHQAGRHKEAEAVLAFIAGPNNMSRASVDRFIRDNALAMGMSSEQLQQLTASNPLYAAIGELHSKGRISSQAVAGAAVDDLQMQFFHQNPEAGPALWEMAFGDYKDADAVQADLDKRLKANPNLPSQEKERMRNLATARKTAGGRHLSLEATGLAIGLPSDLIQWILDRGLDAQVFASQSPVFRAHLATDLLFREGTVAADKKMSKEFAAFNAPIVQHAFSRLMRGDLGYEGLTSLLAVLKNPDDSNLGLIKEITALQGLEAPDSVAAMQKYFGKEKFSSDKFANIKGISRIVGAKEIRAFSGLPEKEAKVRFADVHTALLKRGKDKDAAEWLSVGWKSVQRAAEDIKVFDPGGQSSDEVTDQSAVSLARRTGLGLALGQLKAQSLVTLVAAHQERLRDLLTPADGTPSLFPAADRKVAVTHLKKWGLLDSENKFDMLRVQELTAGTGEDAKKFRLEQAELEKSPTSQGLRAISSNFRSLGEATKGVDERFAHLQGSLESTDKTAALQKAMTDLVASLGGSFGSDLLKKLLDLTTAISEAGKN